MKGLRKLYVRLVPASTRKTIRKYAKTVVAGVGALAQAANYLAPAYGDETQAIVGLIAAAATVVGVRQVPNKRTPAR